MEKLDDLQFQNFAVYQRTDLYRFTGDAVFLADFVEVKKNEYVVDFGTGCGIIPILLCAKKEFKKVTGIEIQPELVELCKKSIEYNNLQDKFDVINCKIQQSHKLILKHPDVVVCNPPYRKLTEGETSKVTSNKIARFEVLIDLAEIVESARRNLKVGGRFYMVHRADRFPEIISCLKRNDFSPRKIQFVHAKPNALAHLVMIESVSGGNCQVKILPSLVLQNEDGSESDEVVKIYSRGEGLDK